MSDKHAPKNYKIVATEFTMSLSLSYFLAARLRMHRVQRRRWWSLSNYKLRDTLWKPNSLTSVWQDLIKSAAAAAAAAMSNASGAAVHFELCHLLPSATRRIPFLSSSSSSPPSSSSSSIISMWMHPFASRLSSHF